MKCSYSLCIILLASFFLSCKSSSNIPSTAPGSSNSISASSTPISAPTPTVEPREASVEEKTRAEAQTEAEAFWKKVLTRCGDDTDSWYWIEANIGYDYQPGFNWLQGRGEPEITVEGTYYYPKALTEAERLNSVDPQPIEFQGVINLHFGVGRHARQPWQDNFKTTYFITKQKGGWLIRHNNRFYRTYKMKCEELTQS